jgi:hypothetical protein
MTTLRDWQVVGHGPRGAPVLAPSVPVASGETKLPPGTTYAEVIARLSDGRVVVGARSTDPAIQKLKAEGKLREWKEAVHKVATAEQAAALYNETFGFPDRKKMADLFFELLPESGLSVTELRRFLTIAETQLKKK